MAFPLPLFNPFCGRFKRLASFQSNKLTPTLLCINVNGLCFTIPLPRSTAQTLIVDVLCTSFVPAALYSVMFVVAVFRALTLSFRFQLENICMGTKFVRELSYFYVIIYVYIRGCIYIYMCMYGGPG